MTLNTRVNQFPNPAFTATRTPYVAAYNRFTNPVLGNATPQLNWNHNAGGATVTTSVVSSGGVDEPVPFRRMAFTTDSTSVGAFGQYVGSTTSSVIPATAGLAYSASIWVRHDLAVARNYTFFLQFYNASNGGTGGATATAVLVQPNTWTRLGFNNQIAPANSVRLIVMAYVSGAAGAGNGVVPAGSNLDMTMPNVDQSIGVQEFFSGDSTGTDYVYAWVGAAHASNSYKSAGAVVATNLLNNPGAETAAFGWYANNSAIATSDRDTAVKHSGTQSARGTNVSGGATLFSDYQMGQSAVVPVTASRWYTFSCWFYTNESNATYQMHLTYLNSGGTTALNFPTTNIALPAGVWTKGTVSGACPADGVTVRTSANISKTGTTPGMNGWADDACLQEGVGTDSFDGTTASDADFVYAWTGTANASTSNKIAKKLATIAAGNTWPIASTLWSGHDHSNRLWSTYAISNGSGYYEIASNTGGAVITTPLQRGVTYRASAQVYVDPAAPIITTVNGLYYSETGVTNNVQDLLTTGFYGERQLSITFTVSTDVAATAWRLRFYNGHIEGALSIWLDNLIVEESPPIDSLPLELGRNYLQNSSFWASTTGWTASTQATITRDVAVYRSAPASLSSTLTRPGGNATYGSYMYVAPITTPIPNGTPLRWSMWLKAERTVSMQFWPVINSALIPGVASRQITVTTSWQEFSYDWVANVDVTNLYVIIGSNTEATTFQFWVDDVFVGTRIPSYFDGNTIRANGYDYSWSGTADASTSIAAPTETGSAPLTLGSGSASMPGAKGSAPSALGSGSHITVLARGSAPLGLDSESAITVKAHGSAPLTIGSLNRAARPTIGSAPLSLRSGSSVALVRNGSAPLTIGSANKAANVAIGSAPLSLSSGSAAMRGAFGSTPLTLASGSHLTILLTGSAPFNFESPSVAVMQYRRISGAPMAFRSLGATEPLEFRLFFDTSPTQSVAVDPIPEFTVYDLVSGPT